MTSSSSAPEIAADAGSPTALTQGSSRSGAERPSKSVGPVFSARPPDFGPDVLWGEDWLGPWAAEGGSSVDPLLAYPPFDGLATVATDKWPAGWRAIHDLPWLDSVWRRLLYAIDHPVWSYESSPGRREHVVLGVSWVRESPSGRLHLYRWRRISTGMCWAALHDREVEVVSVPGRMHWVNDMLQACAQELSVRLRRGGLRPNEGHIHGYVNRCVRIMLKRVGVDPAWRQLPQRVQREIGVDLVALGRARRMLRWSRDEHPILLSEYNRMRKSASSFDRLASERGTFPCAELLLGAWIDHSRDRVPSDPLVSLRRQLMETESSPIKPITWRRLLSLPTRLLRLIETRYDGDVWPAIVNYLRCLEYLDLPYWPNRNLLEHTVSSFAGSYGRYRNHLTGLQQWGPDVGHALRSAMAAEAQGADAEQLNRELPEVLDWLRMYAKPLTKTQRRAGWKWLVERSREWHALQQLLSEEPNAATTEPFEPLELQDHRVEPIWTTARLFEEGQTMDHCVFSRKNRMFCGESLIVSIQQLNLKTVQWDPCATAEYLYDPHRRWVLDQVKGHSNRDPSASAQRLAARLPAILDEMSAARPTREFFSLRSAPVVVRQRRGCPLQPLSELTLKRIGLSLEDDYTMPADRVLGKLWTIERMARGKTADGPLKEIATTETIFEWLDKGHSVVVINGPFNSKPEAAHALGGPGDA